MSGGRPRSGSVFYHHDTRMRSGGHWTGAVSIGGGKRRYFYGHTEAEVREKMTAENWNPPEIRRHPRVYRAKAEATAITILQRAVRLGWSLEFTAKALVAGMSRQRVEFGITGPCVYCGDELAGHVDHVIPQAAGGTDDLDNLVSSCAGCNHRKGDRPVSAAARIAVNRRTASAEEAA